jgi:hypothetical protein
MKKKPAENQSSSAVSPAKPALRIPKILFESDEPVALPAPEPVQKHIPPAPSSPSVPKRSEAVLPQSYGTGKLVLMARDPHWLYAHWDLTAQQRGSARRDLLVRVFAQDKHDEAESESEVHPDSQHCFIYVARAGTTYTAELGYYTPTREWVSIGSSNSVVMPPDAPSSERTVQFATIPPFSASEPQIPATAPTGNHVSRRPVAGGPLEQTDKVTVSTAGSKSVGVSRPEVRAPEPVRVTPGLLERIVGHKQPSATVPSPTPQSSVKAPTPEWTEVQERALLAEFARFQSPGETVSSVTIPELLGAELPAPSVLPIESISSALEARPQPQGFWLNLNAELIVYGATERDAVLTLGGVPIQLRPDGSFTCRFALPDGSYELPVLAVSKTGDVRKATLQFSRSTQQQDDVGAHPQDPALQPPAPGGP